MTDSATPNQNDSVRRPLASRLHVVRSVQNAAVTSPLQCQISSSRAGTHMVLGAPMFLRIGSDSIAPTAHLVQIQSSARLFEIPFLGKSIANSSAMASKSDSRHARVVPVPIDCSLDSQEFLGAAAAEFQLFGNANFPNMARGRLANWSPALPIELESAAGLASKVELVRVMLGNNGLVGAAISPSNVQEDVRYIIDCGFDFVTLLCEVCFGFDEFESRALADSHRSLEHAVQAREKAAAPRFPILLSTHIRDGLDVIDWLSRGANAVCIDRYLVSKKPIPSVASANENFSSFLGGYTTPAQPNVQWIDTAIRELMQQISDRLDYLGHDSLREYLPHL